MTSQQERFGKLEFEKVVRWMLPAFPMVKNQYSITPITVCCISVLANSIKRRGDCAWDETIREKLNSWNLIRGFETYDDMRLNLIIVGEPGSGKTALLSGVKNLNPFRTEFRKSQPNYDQMIGSTEKWQEDGKWKYEVFPGELSSDIYMMDEVLSVYLDDSRENKKIRELLRAGMSRIGTNEITKPQVRIPEGFQCNYYPECTLIQGFQPRKVPVSLITEGDLRRAQVITADFPLKEKQKTYRFGSEAPDDIDDITDDAKYKKAKDYLEYLRELEFDIWIPKTTMDFVKICLENLNEFTTLYGLKAQWFFKIAYFDIESQLLRYAIVMSMVRDSTRSTISVNIEDVKKAFPYFSNSFSDSLIWLNKYTVGDFTGGTIKHSDTAKVEVTIKWLQEEGAFSARETNTKVGDLKKHMVRKGWFSSESGSKRFYQELLKNGIIKSGRRAGTWYVWLSNEGKDMLERSGAELTW